MTYTIDTLPLPPSETDLDELAQLLVDAVVSGAAVSFIAPLTEQRARDWWRSITSTSHPRAITLVARDDEGIAGSVQLHPSWAPNQPHRGDIAKLIVHTRSRRTGLGTRLMHAVEEEAKRAGLTLLTLDTKRGEPSEQLYRRLGWIEVGVIPRYAFDSDGTPHDTVVFYKELSGAGASGPRVSDS